MRRCLFVDDSSVVRKVAVQILETLNYSISEAVSGEEAVTLCQVLMPDIIFLDGYMPGATALETLAAIRAIEADRRPAIVYVTTEYDTLSIARALSAGADDFMMKPFDRDSLLATIARLAENLAA